MDRKKLAMCRICLVEDVRMYVVVNENLQALYEKLTDVPFVTDDRRPMLACFFCCAKLKQCERFQRKCLEAEELFAQIVNEDYKPNTLTNHDRSVFHGGFVKTAIKHTSIYECLIEHNAIKQEPPDVCERQDNIIEPKEEYQSQEVELEYDVPLTEFKTGVKEEREVKNSKETEQLEQIYPHSNTDVEDISPHHSKEDLRDDVPLIEFKKKVKEEQVTPMKTFRDMESSSIVKISTLNLQRTKLEETVKNNKLLDSKTIQNTQIITPDPVITFIKPYKCEICQRSFRDKSNLKTHTRIHTGEKPFKCDVCLRSFSHKISLTKHTLIHTGEKPYKCDICRRSFNQKGSLTTHIRIHTGEKPYNCEICQRSFTTSGGLNGHNLTFHPQSTSKSDTELELYECQICQRCFRNKSNLRKHIRVHNGEKPHKCQICQHSFRSTSDLTRHTRIHTGEKPHKCHVCQRSFNQKCALTAHIRIHTGEKPFKCVICQRSFSTRGSLDRHRISHNCSTSESVSKFNEPFECEICQRCFRNKSNLRKHIRVHNGEKPYKCEICQRGFSNQSDLKRHARIHTGEKPYKCEICERSFTQKALLTTHIQIHTGEKPFKCVLCQRSFHRKGCLKRHIGTAHTERNLVPASVIAEREVVGSISSSGEVRSLTAQGLEVGGVVPVSR